jgi:hypothetical protein
VIVADDEDLEQPAEAVEEKMPEAAAPTPAPTDEADPDPAAAHRNECSRVHAASARIPEGLWRQQWAEAWRKAELPAARDLTPEQLEPARQLVRCYIALAALDGVGLGDRKERHDFVHAATAGETESCKALSAAQLALVLAAVDTYAAARAGAPVEAEYGPGEEPFE